jgi:hypothetical protein
MRWEIERLLRSLIEVLESLQTAVQTHTDTVRDQQERDQQQPKTESTPPPITPILRSELLIPENIERQRRTNDKRQHRQQVWLTWGTWLAFLAAAIYAGFSRFQLDEIQKQTVIAEQQSRPWMKVTRVTLNDPETLSFNQSIMISPGETLTLFRPVKTPIARADIRTEFHLKNIGKSVAQEVRIISELFFVPGPSSVVAVEQEQERFCGQEGPRTSGSPYSRSTVFPDDDVTALISAVGWVSKGDVTHRDGADWVAPVLIGCITYQHPRDFQTRIAYDVAGLKSHDVILGVALSSEQIRFIRDEHHEYAQ